jgi:serine/threonine-protein kinase RsbW
LTRRTVGNALIMTGTGGGADTAGGDDLHTLVHEVVTLGNMAELRSHVLDAAARAGLSAQRADAFALAINEAVANAIQHGGGGGELTLVQDDARRLIAEVSDEGPGMPYAVTITLPPADAPGGRGLWLAGKLADRLDVHRRGTGTTVRLQMLLRADPNQG